MWSQLKCGWSSRENAPCRLMMARMPSSFGCA
jgi:hypothetical protein